MPYCTDEFRFQGVLGRPVSVRDDASLPLVPVRVDDGPVRWVVLDVGAPITVVRIEAPDEGHEVGARLSLLDSRSVLDAPDDSSTHVTRMVFVDAAIWDHDFDASALTTAADVQGVLGADLLGRFALELRLDPAERSITFYDAIAGSQAELTADGWAVYPDAFKGGGRSEAGCEGSVAGRRLVVDACVFPFGGGSGVDATFAVTTRVVGLRVGAEAATRVPGRVGSLAVVGDSDELLGPCEELARREESGRGAAAIRVDGDFTVAAIADSDPALVSVRTEVASSSSRIDGFLGTVFFESVRARLDTPGDRLLLRCEDPPEDVEPTCETMPRAGR